MAERPLLPALDRDAVARTVTAYVNTSIMARGRPIRPDDDFELAGID
jgi:hypothetical protein